MYELYDWVSPLGAEGDVQNELVERATLEQQPCQVTLVAVTFEPHLHHKAVPGQLDGPDGPWPFPWSAEWLAECCARVMQRPQHETLTGHACDVVLSFFRRFQKVRAGPDTRLAGSRCAYQCALARAARSPAVSACSSPSPVEPQHHASRARRVPLLSLARCR